MPHFWVLFILGKSFKPQNHVNDGHGVSGAAGEEVQAGADDVEGAVPAVEVVPAVEAATPAVEPTVVGGAGEQVWHTTSDAL